MDFIETIKSRRSIRAFKPETPSKAVIKECLDAAIWAPSGSNHQPWEFIIVSGTELDRIRDIVEEKFVLRMKEVDAFSDVPDFCQERQEELFEVMGEAAEKSGFGGGEFFQKIMRFFDAPVGVFFVTFKRKDNLFTISAVPAVENFLLAAHSKGLGACWLGIAEICAEDIKAYLGLSENREIIAPIALGYPDENSPINTFTRTRAPADKLTTWIGF